MADPPIVARDDGTVLVSGAALGLMYRACLALLARHRLDGVRSPPLLHEARTVLFRATTMPPMSPARHRDDSHPPAEPCSNRQDPSDWCSVGEASALLGISRRQVQRMAANRSRDGLEAIRVGRTWALRKAPVLALAARRKATR